MPKPAVLVASICAFIVPIAAVFVMTPQSGSMDKMSAKPAGTLMYFYSPS